MIGLAVSIFGWLLWIIATIGAVVTGFRILANQDYYDCPHPAWGVLSILGAMLSGSFMLAVMISAV